MSPYWFVSNEFQRFLFDSIITADTTALAEDSWAEYRSPESFPPLESFWVLEAFGSNRLKQRAVIKLWTQRGKPRVMPAKNQYLPFVPPTPTRGQILHLLWVDTNTQYSSLNSLFLSSEAEISNHCAPYLCLFHFRKLDHWSCGLVAWHIKWATWVWIWLFLLSIHSALEWIRHVR